MCMVDKYIEVTELTYKYFLINKSQWLYICLRLCRYWNLLAVVFQGFKTSYILIIFTKRSFYHFEIIPTDQISKMGSLDS